MIARYQGERAEKRVGSLPFTLRVNTHDRSTSVRMSSEVPVSTTVVAKEAGSKEGGAPVTSYQLRNIGTNIDCSAEVIEGGRYLLQLTMSDSQIFNSPGQGSSLGRPLSVQSFTSTLGLIIRDGETIQHTTATDKSTGETVKVEVTLNVVK